MADFETGQRVEADISAKMPELGVTVITHGTITGRGTAPNTFLVQTDVPFNGNHLFQLEADCLGIGPSTIPPPRRDPPMADLKRIAQRILRGSTEPAERGGPTQAEGNGRKGALNGGRTGAERLTPEERSQIEKRAAAVRRRNSS